MNKQEYMHKLYEELSQFDDEIRDEIVNDYEEHFSMGLANGKTEEQIVSELGPVEALIDELKELKGEKKAEKKVYDFESFANDFTKAVGGFTKGLAGFMGSLAGNVTKNAEKAGGTFAEGAESFVNGFSEAAEKVINKGNEFAQYVAEGYKQARGEDETKSSAKTDEMTGFSENCKKLSVETDCGNITLKRSEGSGLYVNYVNHGTPNQQLAYKFDCYEKNGTLFVKVTREMSVSNFFKSLGCPEIDINIVVPSDLEDITIDCASGKINFENIKVEDLEINNVSGMVDITGMEADSADINNVSGPIVINDSFAESLDINTVSGFIKINANAEKLDAATVSGSINANVSGLEKADCSSVSGNINITLENAEGFTAETSSTSGKINLFCKDNKVTGSRSGNYVMGDGSVKVDASSMSGSITIEC